MRFRKQQKAPLAVVSFTAQEVTSALAAQYASRLTEAGFRSGKLDMEFGTDGIMTITQTEVYQ